MSKLLLYFAQLTHTKNGINQNRSFPLAAGVISEYLLSKFKDSLEIKVFKTPEKLNSTLLEKKPDILSFSNYLWNENLSLEFAKEAKKIYPDVLTIIGGPNLSLNKNSNINYLINHPYVDKLVFYDGEIPAYFLVKDFIENRDIERIRGLNILNTMGIRKGDIINDIDFSKKAEKIGNDTKILDDIPSPYLSGMFDEFFLEGEVPLLETMRGCPFSCSFCQQGNEYFTMIRNFSVERIKNEIEYMAKKIYDNNLKVESVWITDPNFAMYQRDSEIIQKMRETQDKYNFPKSVLCSTGKNNAELIIRSTSLLKKGSILLRNAVQSLDPETLKAVDRSNIKLEAYKKIQDHITELGMESNADIMLGLPNETRQAHFDGIFKLIDSNTKEISCLQTIMLKGTKLEEDDYVNKYDIKTKKRVIPACFKTYNILNNQIDVVELDRIIIGNNTLSFDEYLQCRKLHLSVITFHNSRLMNPVYHVLNHFNIPKSTIYKKLFGLNNSDYNKIVNDFLDETRNELFEDLNKFKEIHKDLNIPTSNKIFRALSISFYRKKEVLLSIIREVLTDILTINKKDLIDDLINILNLSIISPFEGELKNYEYQVKSEELQNISGKKVNIYLSENQRARLEILYEVFNNDEDKINIMAYHLRPENMTRQVSYLK